MISYVTGQFGQARQLIVVFRVYLRKQADLENSKPLVRSIGSDENSAGTIHKVSNLKAPFFWKLLETRWPQYGHIRWQWER
nr:hypothetical protein [Pelagibacterium lentulum]